MQKTEQTQVRCADKLAIKGGCAWIASPFFVSFPRFCPVPASALLWSRFQFSFRPSGSGFCPALVPVSVQLSAFRLRLSFCFQPSGSGFCPALVPVSVQLSAFRLRLSFCFQPSGSGFCPAFGLPVPSTWFRPRPGTFAVPLCCSSRLPFLAVPLDCPPPVIGRGPFFRSPRPCGGTPCRSR